MGRYDDPRRVRRAEERSASSSGSALWFIIGGVIAAALVLFLFGDFRGDQSQQPTTEQSR